MRQQHDPHNYTDRFFPIYYGCKSYECKICFGRLKVFPLRQFMIHGQPFNSPEAIELRMKMAKKFEQLKLFSAALPLLRLGLIILFPEDYTPEEYAEAVEQLDKHEKKIQHLFGDDNNHDNN